jgi:hypothetical protein
MLSGLYSFSQIIEDVKQETGITNLRNEYPQIRQLIARAEREINPYAGFLIRKRMVFFVGNGNFDGKKIKKPSDFVQIDKVGCCDDGLCSGSYYENISHIILCDNVQRDKIAFTYWGIQCDGDGNPITTFNHAEAVVAYIVWKLYSPKVFVGEASGNQRDAYKREFEDRCGESRGEDFFPSSESLMKMRQLSSMSTKEMDTLFCEDYCSSCDCITTISDNQFMEKKVWWWQMKTINNKITNDTQVTDAFLLDKNQITLGQAINGYTYSYPYIGQIGFCIEDVLPNSVEIFDLLNMNMNNSLFSFYDVSKRRLIFVSKEYKSPSSIFLKFNYNGN